VVKKSQANKRRGEERIACAVPYSGVGRLYGTAQYGAGRNSETFTFLS